MQRAEPATVAQLLRQWGSGDRNCLNQLLPIVDAPFDPGSDGYGTGLDSLALQRAGVPRNEPRMMKALAWLERESG